MRKSIIIIILLLAISFLFIACNKDNKEPEKEEPIDLEEIEIDVKDKTIVLKKGETKKIAFDVISGNVKIEYEIEDSTIISINKGTITALKAGKTNVKLKAIATDEGVESKEYTISVEVTINTYTITYQSNIDDYTRESETLTEGETKTFDEKPELTGYRFVGWFSLETNDYITDTTVVIDKDMIVIAFFYPAEYTIRFETDEGVLLGSTKVPSGQVITLAPQSQPGSTFLGWTLEIGSTDYITEITVTSDVTVYANFELFTYTITYELDGATYNGQTEAEYGEVVILKSPTKEGYNFLGWSLESASTTYVKNVTITSDVTLYANFAPKEYKITYELYDGTYTGATTIKHGETLTLTSPTKEGFTFLGWTLTEGSNEYITEITGEGNIKLYADYKENKEYPENTYPIRYYLSGGYWNVIYKMPDEIGIEFMADFKESSGRDLTPDKLDCNYLESVWFADMMASSTYKDKWLWLLDAIWEVNGSPANYKADTADFTNNDIKGFYLANLNGFFTSTSHKDTYIGPASANFALEAISRKVYSKGTPLSEEIGPDTYLFGTGLATLPKPLRSGFEFVRWEDTDGNEVTSISTTQTGEVVLVAKWKEETKPEDIEFTNLPKDGLKLYESIQLEWNVLPSDAVNKKVVFICLTSSILSVTEDGEIRAKKVGTGKVKITLKGNPNFEKIIEIPVYSGEYFDVSYETNSYVEVDHQVKLLAQYIDKDKVKNDVTWSSLTEEIASVDENGNVTGLSEGLATIRATYKDGIYFDFYVTVLNANISEALRFVIDNHISNAKTTYNLGIGSGTPEYYYDVVSGVNNLLFDSLKIDYRYYDKLPEGTKNYGKMSSVEFITVHYTGNMKDGADADNNCSYFNNLEYRASIHYVTGRTNLTDLTGQSAGYNADAYYAFAGLSEKYAGWHATNADPAIWDYTGLEVLDGDPLTPVISISSNLKYTINGRETNIKIPEAPSGYKVNGNILTVSGRDYSVFNKYGLITKVVDGKYYLARTHWGTQREPRCLCTCGGNLNSIGIESCVDKGSDLEHTWHVTAQLVAGLLLKYNLGFDRVVGHHFFSGKDCPQPFLEKDMKLWYEFMDMVKAEYELLITYKDAEITSKALKSDGILKDNGLLIQDENAHCVTYEVTIKIGDVTQKVTLATCVESYFKYDGTRSKESLQIQNAPII